MNDKSIAELKEQMSLSMLTAYLMMIGSCRSFADFLTKIVLVIFLKIKFMILTNGKSIAEREQMSCPMLITWLVMMRAC